jgi:AhpD family alkylhydroperoxidase
MNSFTLHTLETAPAESKALLTTVMTRFGFLPNVYAYLAEAPTALEALLQLSAIFSRTSLTEPQRHVLLLTSSVENQCTFCAAAHTRGARAGGVGMDSIESIRKGAIPECLEDAAMVSFVRAIIRSRGFVSDAELKAFFDHGFTPRNALEVVLGVTVKVLTNYTNHITHTELNPELSAYALPNS